MSLTLLQNVNFGPSRTGQPVGYTILDTAGAVVTARTTAGIYETAPGIYAANVVFPDVFNGQILWDCPAFGAFAIAYASEPQNVQANDPRISDLYDMGFGRWKINKATNQMVFYKADNVTIIATYDLLDDAGAPTFDGVFERQKV